VIFPGWVPFKNLAVSQDIPDWIRAQDIAMGYQWQTLFAAYGNNSWAIFKAYLDAAAAKVAAPVVAKYLGSLAALGSFGDHP
jgi:hypothetical protein